MISVFYALGEWSKNRHSNDSSNDSSITNHH